MTQLEFEPHLAAVRIRDIYLQTMIQTTALARIKRSLDSKTRPAAELLRLNHGDLVDLYRVPTGPQAKDLIGWRSPGRVVDAEPETLEDGLVHVRWQGRALPLRLQDLRRHLVHWIFLPTFNSRWQTLKNFTQTLQHRAMMVGWYYSSKGWFVSAAAKQNPCIFGDVVFIASTQFNLQGCIGARFGAGVSSVKGLPCTSHSIIAFWSDETLNSHSECEMIGLDPLDCRQVFGDSWHRTFWINFLHC